MAKYTNEDKSVAITRTEPVQARVLYTKEQKISAVKLLQDCNYDYRKVSQQLGIKYDTLRSWASRYKDIQLPTQTQIIAAKVELDLEQMKREFISKHFEGMDELAQKAVSRALELIEVEEDLNKVNNTIKILTDFFAKMQNATNVDDPSRPGSAVTVNLIQQSIQMLNQKK